MSSCYLCIPQCLIGEQSSELTDSLPSDRKSAGNSMIRATVG